MRLLLVVLAFALAVTLGSSGPVKYGARWTAGDKTFVQILTPLNWTLASEACQQANATLVSWGSMEDIESSFYNESMTGTAEYEPFYLGLRIKLPPKSANAQLRRMKPPPPPPKPPGKGKGKGKKPPPPQKKHMRLLQAVEDAVAAGEDLSSNKLTNMRKLQQSWTEAGAEQKLLQNSGFTWSDGSSTLYIRTQTMYMTLRECAQAADKNVQAECCAYVYNAGADAYDGHAPLINFQPCKIKTAFVCQKEAK
uniref:C-type lectin domain-containing protein n=1 Tax=Chlamydomonas leiostraca TaxID=1034604 RepID=A0A7S0RQE2_9CHLO|mmetsp:Transcript_28880/g.73721  ORF Transcript_28880/g.73721 Transcript_28880/m.73721 type:complete len:252 (+) Transcript_28880:182-937(+)|eukprot:CAMPEP_0202870284 /NCGR_PEP_ID=MMETSP1391-20130828/15229_1 /ASSEMBLY_ACC=CAM_ASM_000867 /TAXON_ID=1034604 /ORGANISM="Chlamydomonas leiostraca, Strain SAG 11-49" /LENGTH=251 /DNA_ID=CAMNT_0049550813 /DNA_START=79 /DNA_END=834 /DNA_ORIENTATION=+